MKFGLAGYSGSGVTTLLAVLSEDVSLAGRHGGPEVRSITIPDDRLDQLVALFKPKKITPLHLEVAELGDLRPEEGGGLRRETLARAAGLDAMAVVLRGFAAPAAPQCRPVQELEQELSDLSMEFCLSDLIPVENRLTRLSKEGRSSSPEALLLGRIKDQLEEGVPVRKMDLGPEEGRSLAGYHLLTQFPLFVLVNVGEEGAGSLKFPSLAEACARDGIGYFEACGKLELELLEIPQEERGPFMEESGVHQLLKDRFPAEVFRSMKLITFFTVGEREVHAWMVREGTPAARAAGKIHSDMEKGFIRGEVIPWDECVSLGGLNKAKEAGRLRVEGKEYVVKDGEIFHVRFNV